MPASALLPVILLGGGTSVHGRSRGVWALPFRQAVAARVDAAFRPLTTRLSRPVTTSCRAQHEPAPISGLQAVSRTTRSKPAHRVEFEKPLSVGYADTSRNCTCSPRKLGRGAPAR
eukprot:ctg_868.g431